MNPSWSAILNPKPATASHPKKSSRQFSLVSAEAQQQMYRALCALHANGGGGGSATKGAPGVPGQPALDLSGHSGGVPGKSAFDLQGCSGAEIAEIATCLAAGASCPLVFACSAPGARIVAEPSRVVGARGRRLTSATLAAMDALLTRSLNHAEETSSGTGSDAAGGKNSRGKRARAKTRQHPREDVAIVCAGLLDAGAEAERDYRAAFGFAARHKLPILYVVANRLTAGQSAQLHPSKPTTGFHPSTPESGALGPPGLPGTPALDLRSIYPELGIPLFTVDAADAIAAYRVATEALHNARHLRGPSVIEALVVPHTAEATAGPVELLTAYMERHGNPPQ